MNHRNQLPAMTTKLRGLSGLIIIGLLWQLTYTATNFLPGPIDVLWALAERLGQTTTYVALGESTLRFFAGMLLACIFGIGMAMLASESWLMRQIMIVWVNATLTLPSLLTALLCLIVFGITSVGVIVAVFIIIFPYIAIPTYDGIKTIDSKLLQMASLYKITDPNIYKHILIPHVAPFLVGGVRNASALAWRALIVAEIFSVRSGLGHEFDNAFDTFNFADVIVWLILLLMVIGSIELFILKPVENWVNQWNR